MTLDGRDVAVVGAGIGGLAAALLLARAGASVTLLERRADATEVGAGILLQPNGLAVLAGLGLDDRLRQAGRPVRRMVVHASGRTPVMDIPCDFLALRRADLHRVLLGAVAGEPAISCRFGAEVTGADSTGSVDLVWHGRPGTLTADLVVGADGVHSTIRAAGEFAATRPAPGRRYLRGLVPLVDGVDLAGEHWTAAGLFGGAPVDPHTQYFYCSAGARPVADALAAGDLGGLRRSWSAALPLAGRVLDAVPRLDDLLVTEVAVVRCERWHDGRTVLLGDAAHAMAPNAGQGANSALVDAAVLTAELAGQPRLYPALERYTRRRLPAVRRVQDRAQTLARVAEIDSAALRRGRDLLVRALTRLPGGGRRTMRDLQQEDPVALRRTVAALAHVP
jgi:2-polyprenyl-6-methoxyphenol hydroxylase-like FAD-dependent oxidoreductase